MQASVAAPASFPPARPGRVIVLCSMEGCTPCERVYAGLRGDPLLQDHHEVSEWRPGDTPLRRAHRQAGALRYPTALLVDSGVVLGTIEGFWESEGEPMMEPFRQFILNGALP